MTRLLVSVRDETEAKIALAAGVDLIDVKEPSRGSLGAASPAVWHTISEVCRDTCPVSAALGELLNDDVATLAAQTNGLSYAKVGLAGCADRHDWLERWQACLAQLPGEVAAVAVAYADADRARSPRAEVVLDNAIAFGCRALLFDTYHKGSGDLFDHLPFARLRDLVWEAHSHGLLVVLGGSLNELAIPIARQLRVDYLAVRGAVCRVARDQCVDRSLIEHMLHALRSSNDDCDRLAISQPATESGLSSLRQDPQINSKKTF